MVKYFKARVATFCFAICLPVLTMGAELAKDQLNGKWIYLRIVAEDYRIDVNRYIDFRPDNTVVTYHQPDKELSSATYELTGKKIVYTDEKGEQHWVILNYDGSSLTVDHQGAKMFFERPDN